MLSPSLHLRAAWGEDIDDIDDIDKEIALFKQSLRSATDQYPFSAREHIETILYPFFKYCLEKMSGSFRMNSEKQA